MNILFDHQIFSYQKYGGISRYFYELMKHFPPEIDFKNSTLLSYNHYISQDNIVPSINFLPNLNIRGKARITNPTNKLSSILRLKKGNFDIFHPTYYDPYFSKYIQKKPFVLTIHDMTHERHPEFFNPIEKTQIWKKELAKKASHIITVSNNTKNDLIELYGIPERKITTVYHGFNFIKTNDKIKLTLPKDFLLYVGDRVKYKNFDRFIAAYANLQKDFPDLAIITVGGGAFNQKEIALFNKLKINNKVSHVNANDSELRYLYNNASLFVFPSIYEGFGIPILESFSCNCPAALSHNSCFPEIAGDAAEYFNPYETEAIEASIKKVLTNESYKLKLIKLGQIRLKEFSWTKAAKETAEIYHELY